MSGKRGRFKRNKKNQDATLTMDDIEYLKLNTRYDEKEIREWFRSAKQK